MYILSKHYCKEHLHYMRQPSFSRVYYNKYFSYVFVTLVTGINAYGASFIRLEMVNVYKCSRQQESRWPVHIFLRIRLCDESYWQRSGLPTLCERVAKYNVMFGGPQLNRYMEVEIDVASLLHKLSIRLIRSSV